METVDFVLSVGPRCGAAHHIRRVFGRNALRGIFDWQVTPVDALVRALADDFAGLFELEDLQLGPAGVVVNRRIGTEHPHEFPSGMAAADLAAHFGAAQARHIWLAAATRRALRGRHRLLVQASEPLAEIDRFRIERALRAYAPDLRFVLNAGPPQPPGSADWRGDPAAWDRALAPFRIAAAARLRARMAVWFGGRRRRGGRAQPATLPPG